MSVKVTVNEESLVIELSRDRYPLVSALEAFLEEKEMRLQACFAK